MSAQTIHDVYAPIEERNREIVMENTWGHLAPKKGKRYTGRIVYAVGCFGSDPHNPVALVCEFYGLDMSPWFFDAMSEFIASQNNESGRVYEFRGIFRNYEFNGKVTTLLKA